MCTLNGTKCLALANDNRQWLWVTVLCYTGIRNPFFSSIADERGTEEATDLGKWLESGTLEGRAQSRSELYNREKLASKPSSSQRSRSPKDAERNGVAVKGCQPSCVNSILLFLRFSCCQVPEVVLYYFLFLFFFASQFNRWHVLTHKSCNFKRFLFEQDICWENIVTGGFLPTFFAILRTTIFLKKKNLSCCAVSPANSYTQGIDNLDLNFSSSVLLIFGPQILRNVWFVPQ